MGYELQLIKMYVFQMLRMKSDSETIPELNRQHAMAPVGTCKPTAKNLQILATEENTPKNLERQLQDEDCYTSSQKQSSPYTQRKKLKKNDNGTPEINVQTNLIQMEVSTASPELTIDIECKVKKLLDELVQCNENISEENIKFVTVHRAQK